MTAPSESEYASIARRLAEALIKMARERGDTERKAVAAIQMELCEMWRREQAELVEPQQSAE